MSFRHSPAVARKRGVCGKSTRMERELCARAVRKGGDTAVAWCHTCFGFEML